MKQLFYNTEGLAGKKKASYQNSDIGILVQ